MTKQAAIKFSKHFWKTNKSSDALAKALKDKGYVSEVTGKPISKFTAINMALYNGKSASTRTAKKRTTPKTKKRTGQVLGTTTQAPNTDDLLLELFGTKALGSKTRLTLAKIVMGVRG